MSTSATAFPFQRDFGAARTAEPRPKLPIAHAEHLRLLDEARLAGYHEGLEAGRTRADEGDLAQLATTLSAFERAFAQHSARVQEIEAAARAAALEFALIFARKLAGHLIEQAPLALIEATASEVFDDLRKAPHVAARVSPELVDSCKTSLGARMTEQGIGAKLFVFPDPELKPGDCRIEWAEGGISREGARLGEAIEAALRATVPGSLAVNDPEEDRSDGR